MIKRRNFLKQAALFGATTGMVATSGRVAAKTMRPSMEKTLKLYNIHTGETVQATFWAEGRYIEEEVQMLDMLLRDHRANEVLAMQRKLYHHLFKLQMMLEPKQGVHIISGYRSPETNRRLQSMSNGVAKKSLHMQGRAIDIRMPGVSIRNVQRAALSMKTGGVGYYPTSGFVHIDTGRVRNWAGS